jgi:hypothetical protein
VNSGGGWRVNCGGGKVNIGGGGLFVLGHVLLNLCYPVLMSMLPSKITITYWKKKLVFSSAIISAVLIYHL